MMGLGMGLGILVLLVFWAVLIVGGVWLVRGLFAQGDRSGGNRGAPPTPRQILDQRYARGELSKEEYDLIRRDLEGRSP